VPVPEYDEQAARAESEWASVAGAPDQLHDVPTRCIFCGEFVPITDVDPILVIAKPWQRAESGWLYAANEVCLSEHGEKSGTR
jgi:hypothetical protein